MDVNRASILSEPGATDPATEPAATVNPPTTFPKANTVSSEAVWNSVKSATGAKMEAPSGAVKSPPEFAILGSMPDGDIEALAFLTLMQSAKSAQEDLRAIMAQVKAINGQKQTVREHFKETLDIAQQDSATPDPKP